MITHSKARFTAYLLGGTASALVLASVLGQGMYYLPHHNRIQQVLSTMFYVDKEFNVPSTFSALLLLFAGILLFSITLKKIKFKLTFGHWFVLACGFSVMAIDEMFSFHERLIHPVHTLLTNVLNVEHLGIFRFAWVIPGMALVAVLIPYFWKFVWGLPRHTRRNFLLSATLYLGGAIGVELLGGYLFATQGSTESFLYSMVATVEEGLEMVGVILFIQGLMIHLAEMPKLVNVPEEITPTVA